MPLRKKKVFRRKKSSVYPKTKDKLDHASPCTTPLQNKMDSEKKQQIPNLTGGISRSLNSNTRQKTPIIRIPATKICSSLPRIKKKLNPTLLNYTRTSEVRPRPEILTFKKPRLAPYEGIYKCYGLSPKEKMQIIGTCQTRSNRYAQLKRLAADAIKNNKIFTVYGACKAVREALVERGWVEKIPTQRMNMKNIYNGRIPTHEIRKELETLLLSNFVQKYSPSFIWRTKEFQGRKDSTIDMTKDYTPTVNKLEIDTAWTTKQGLCSTIKRNYWFYIEGVAEVYCPRTYNSFDPSEVDSFKNDFKLTACTSLLKWVLAMVANDRAVFVSNGTVSIKVFLFAVNRCKDYLYIKQNKDIDRSITNVSQGQWKTFMKNYLLVISKVETFNADKKEQLSLYLSYARFILKEIYNYRPQLSCEGCHNIWIIKPAHCCRGRGIKMASKLEDVSEMLNKSNAKYVMQKYIEEPLLVHETKFDIRQYYLITSTSPLIIWMYKDCYLKFSTQKYNLKNYHESIHLTNNAVQKKYTNCENRHKDLPLSNMWDSDTFIDYLNKNGKENVWETVVYPGMKKAIRSIVLGCQDSLIACKNRFELYGCDFLLDKEYKPWLIEINSCPDLQPTTPVTAKICPAVIRDIIKVVIDHAEDPSAATGRFECIYKQPCTLPWYTGGELMVRGYSLPSSYFYKGKHEFKEPLHNLNHKQLDIAAVMKIMKKIYDEETGLIDQEENKELPDTLLWDRQSSVIAVESKSSSFITDNSTRTLEKVESILKACNSEELNKSVSNYTMHGSCTSKSSTSSIKETNEPSVVAGGSSSNNDLTDLEPLENLLLDLTTSNEKFDALIHDRDTELKNIDKLSQYQDATTHAIFNLFAFLSKKEREERVLNSHQFNLKEG